MKKYDIFPTEDNLKISIDKDITGRNKDIFYLLKLLNLQDGSWSIAIDGAWGTGKTFFVKQCQYMLENLPNHQKLVQKLGVDQDVNIINQKNFRTIYYDAWEHDQNSDPIESILTCIAQSNWKSNVKETVIKAIDIGVNILAATTPIGGGIKELKNNLLKNQNSNSLKQLKKEFNETLSELAPENGQLIIFVDELDRCKPTYAVKVLERIKHYFNNPNVTFIFSVDISQLQNTIRRYYGNQFNGYHYLDRFFDIVIKLPEPDLTKYLDNTENILEIDTLFDGRKNNYYHNFCIELIKHFSLSLRQINHFYLKTNSATYNLINSTLHHGFSYSNHGKFIIYTFILPLMCALNQYDFEAYNNFIDGHALNNTLEILAKSSSFTTYYKNLLGSESKKNLNMLNEVNKIYNFIFNNSSNTSTLVISEEASIEWPTGYKDTLIKSCALLSPTVKYEDKINND